VKVIFFCGDQSRYGAAHLKPLLESKFSVLKVIIPTQKRWDIFQRAMQGETYYKEYKISICDIRSIAKLILQSKLFNLIRNIIFKTKTSTGNIKQINVEQICSQNKISIEQVFDINDDIFYRELRNDACDLIISAAYPQIFSAHLLKLPSKGAINFHPSALPRCRGAHPHYWAIASGELVGGITAHFMTEKLDDGDIIAQIEFPIAQYNYWEHYDKILSETPNLVKKVGEYFCENSSRAIPQASEKMSYFTNDREIHHRIFWNIHDAEMIFNIYRAGGAFFFMNSNKIILLHLYITYSNRNMTNHIEVENGTVVDFTQDAVVVKALGGFINIKEVYCVNRKYSWREWANGFKIRIGMIME
jgi:methionyl-tRNA formyltransferase